MIPAKHFVHLPRRAIENTVETICNIIETDDAQEGLNAFNEKRPPNW